MARYLENLLKFPFLLFFCGNLDKLQLQEFNKAKKFSGYCRKMEEISLKVERGAGKSAPTHSTLKIPLFPANLITLKVRHLFKQDTYVFHNKMIAK